MPSLTFNIEGEFDNDYISRALKILGELVINEVRNQIRNMRLIQSGDLLQHWFAHVEGTTLTIESSHEYANYLEYGTYAYHNIYGMTSFPKAPHPKKKDMTEKQREAYPAGMQPFAPVRRVLYNRQKMKGLIIAAFDNAQ